MFGKSRDVGDDDGHVVHLVGHVREGGLVGGGLEDEEGVELTVPDGAVTDVMSITRNFRTAKGRDIQSL